MLTSIKINNKCMFLCIFCKKKLTKLYLRTSLSNKEELKLASVRRKQSDKLVVAAVRNDLHTQILLVFFTKFWLKTWIENLNLFLTFFFLLLFCTYKYLHKVVYFFLVTPPFLLYCFFSSAQGNRLSNELVHYIIFILLWWQTKQLYTHQITFFVMSYYIIVIIINFHLKIMTCQAYWSWYWRYQPCICTKLASIAQSWSADQWVVPAKPRVYAGRH